MAPGRLGGNSRIARSGIGAQQMACRPVAIEMQYISNIIGMKNR
jgi:hypothetical protein